MEKHEVRDFLSSHRDYFHPSHEVRLEDELLAADENKTYDIKHAELVNPTKIMMVSYFVGFLGIDRFMLGDNAMGALKLFTLGGFGILTFVDWFTLGSNLKEKNYKIIKKIIEE